jgi:hypothetical protein
VLGYLGEINQKQLKTFKEEVTPSAMKSANTDWSENGNTCYAAKVVASKSKSTRSDGACACCTEVTDVPGYTVI